MIMDDHGWSGTMNRNNSIYNCHIISYGLFKYIYLKHILAIQFEIKQTQKHHETSLTNRTSLTTAVSCGSGCPSPSSRRPRLALLRGLGGAEGEGEGAGAGSASSAIAKGRKGRKGRKWPADQPRLWKMLLTNLWKLLFLDGGCRKEFSFSLIFFAPFSGVVERCCASCKLWCEGISKHAFKNLC